MVFESDIGIVTLHPSKRKHGVGNYNQNYFDSYGCSSLQELSRFIRKRKRYCLISVYKIQGLTSKRDCHCAVFCLYITYLAKVLGKNFKTAVLNFSTK